MADAALPPALELLRARVPDALTFRVLRIFVETRRRPGTTLEEGVAAVLGAIDRGELVSVVREASKSRAQWEEEQALARAIRSAVAPFAGRSTTGEAQATALAEVRRAVARVCLLRYPRCSPRRVNRSVRDNVAFTLRRLDIRTERLVADLSVTTRGSSSSS